jgi:F-type H+/Na+-transporting ATPase subunit alpha
LEVRAQEAKELLKNHLQRYAEELRMERVGTVLEVGDGIARVYGLADAMSSELIAFPGGVMGIVFNLEEDNVGLILLGPDERIKEGDQVTSTGRIADTIVGPAVFGRVMSPLGEPLDGKGSIAATARRELEIKAPGVIARQPVTEPLYTGLKAIDAMIPIGRGQRELIIGDRQTGKTAIAVDAIINQKGTDVMCVYVAIGQKMSTVRRIEATLEQYGVMDKTCIIAAGASDPAALQYIAPYAGCTIAEDLRDNGGHALVIYDDLSKHAAAYRQVSLLLRRPPGREAYPGDVFNLHSRLLERAAKMSDANGAGSLTALPIVETQEGDFSAYIPTNVISITDGQIYLEPDLFYQGVRPAINVGLSVSRVGGSAQTQMMRRVAGRLKLDLASYRENAAFAQFASDLDERTRGILARGERVTEVLKQPQYSPMPVVDQVVAVFAGTRGYWDDVVVDKIGLLEGRLLAWLHEKHQALVDELTATLKLPEGLDARLTAAVEEFKATLSAEDKSA